MGIRELLCEELKKFDDVIIYGYRDIGTCVLDYIISFETDIKKSNYDGKVKFFAHSGEQEETYEKKGISIKSIMDLSEYIECALVIIATQEQHHQNITDILNQIGFRHRLYISHLDYLELKEIVENHNGIVKNQVMQYSMAHQFKLQRLKNQIIKGKKVKVFFMTQRAAAFGCASVYRAMEKNDLFEPYILTISKRDIYYKDFYADVLEDVKFFQERGYRVICGYDEHQNPIDLSIVKPDIVFFDSPNLYGPANNSHFRMDHINWAFLTCYVPYGLLMVDSFYYHYNNINVRESWRFFLDTASSYNRAMSDAEFNGCNMVMSGYPKFDDYFVNAEKKLPDKLNNERKTVIYAPHWSLDIENNFSTFDLYKDVVLEIVKSHPEINFVFKPHPELGFRIKALNSVGKLDFSFEDYLAYMKTWERLPNGICLTEGDYISIFMRSDGMITDCGSFIGEYLPSLHPCIYIFNPRKKCQDEAYTPLARKILDTYYIVRTREELEEYIEIVILNGNDPKYEQRRECLKTEFSNVGNAGKYICEYLQKELVDEQN